MQAHGRTYATNYLPRTDPDVLKRGRLDQWGEKNSMAKVSAEDVTRIRDRRGRGEKLATIAMDYNLSVQQVSRIALGQRQNGGGDE